MPQLDTFENPLNHTVTTSTQELKGCADAAPALSNN
jgi:hypothetical protein